MSSISWRKLVKKVKQDFKCMNLKYGEIEVLTILHENYDDGSLVPIGIFVDEVLQAQMKFEKDCLIPIEGDKENPLVKYCKKWRPFKVIQPEMGTNKVQVVAHAYSTGEGKQRALNVTPVIVLTGMETRIKICQQNSEI